MKRLSPSPAGTTCQVTQHPDCLLPFHHDALDTASREDRRSECYRPREVGDQRRLFCSGGAAQGAYVAAAAVHMVPLIVDHPPSQALCPTTQKVLVPAD